jgi:phosphate transport system substrate-binding protein
MLAAGPAHAQMLMNGAGATFPFPIYSKWFAEHAKVDPSVRVNYQSIGSGGGIRQITERTVDFGASDGPMNDEQLKKLPAELFHIPTVLGADVATYNLPGNPQLRFTGEVLADIFLGRITKWNDDRIKTLNPSSNLPDQPILVVHRSDGSGTTYIWVDYLCKVSKEWEQKTPGALGYVELAYAIQSKMPTALVKNHVGKFIEPTIETTTAAAAGAAKNMPGDFRVSITDVPRRRRLSDRELHVAVGLQGSAERGEGPGTGQVPLVGHPRGAKVSSDAPLCSSMLLFPPPWSPRSRPRSSRSRSPESLLAAR